MALTPEDKKDVKTHLGKALANKVSSVTKDGGHPSKEFKTSISDVRNNFSKEYKEKGLAMRAERVAKEAKSKALQGKSGGHKQGEREARSKKAGHYVHGHKNYGDVYEA